MKAEEKYKIGMFKNVHPDVMKFIHDNSNTVCPFGKYDNTLVCSQYDLIRLVKPILSQLEKEMEKVEELRGENERLRNGHARDILEGESFAISDDRYTQYFVKTFGKLESSGLTPKLKPYEDQTKEQ